MPNAFMIAALVLTGFFALLSMMIVHQLSKRGVKINYLLLRLYLIKYIGQYKSITLKETGKVGPLYYPCVTSIVLALVLAVVGIISKAYF
jgi:hypothetical protein